MTPDDWQRVKEIFQAALDLPRAYADRRYVLYRLR